jgi:hypothetical protein
LQQYILASLIDLGSTGCFFSFDLSWSLAFPWRLIFCLDWLDCSQLVRTHGGGDHALILANLKFEPNFRNKMYVYVLRIITSDTYISTNYIYEIFCNFFWVFSWTPMPSCSSAHAWRCFIFLFFFLLL